MKILITSILLLFSTIGQTSNLNIKPSWFYYQNESQSILDLNCGPANAVMQIRRLKSSSRMTISKLKYNNPDLPSSGYWSLYHIKKALLSSNIQSNVIKLDSTSLINNINNDKVIIIYVDMFKINHSNIKGYGKNYLTPWFSWPHFLTISGYYNGYYIVQDTWYSNGYNIKYTPYEVLRLLKTPIGLVM